MSTIDTDLGQLIKILYDAALQTTPDPKDATLCVLMVLDKWFSEYPDVIVDSQVP